MILIVVLIIKPIIINVTYNVITLKYNIKENAQKIINVNKIHVHELICLFVVNLILHLPIYAY